MSSRDLGTIVAAKRQSGTKLPATRRAGRAAVAVTVALLGLGMGGCQQVGDYLNLRNSFLNPAEVGRFDKANPFGDVKPVTWPILAQLGIADETPNQWANATDPTPADLIAENKEYVLGTGDVVQVEIFELVAPGTAWQRQTKVNDVGMIGIQNVGNIQVAGLTPSQVEQKIAQVLVEKQILPAPGPGQPGPQVNVLLIQSRARLFSILGAVVQPGSYEVLGNDFNLLQALALARDIPTAGGLQGLDYLYIIRQVPYTEKPESETPTPAVPTTGGATETPKTGSPLDVLESIEKGTTRPATETAPAGTGPSSQAPAASVPTAMVASSGASGPAVAQADLEAALGAPTTTQAATTAPTPAPATPAAVAETMPAGTAPATVAGARNPNYVWVDGKWVPVAGAAPSAPIGTGPGPLAGVETAPEKLTQQRVIRISIPALRAGVSKYNVIIKPGDVINVPPVESGEFYMMGNVSRPGVYSLTGRQITLKMAVAAAGNLGPLAIPRRCEVTRRIGTDQEAIIQVNMQAIFDGEQPDIFLKPNDVVNVGTDAVAPFLAVMRNAYRFSYGFGFVYDRNFYLSPSERAQQTVR